MEGGAWKNLFRDVPNKRYKFQMKIYTGEKYYEN